MLGTIVDVVKLVRDVWPTRWSNFESRFVVDEMMGRLTVSSKGAGRGRLRVILSDPTGRMIASLEGPACHDGEVQHGCNLEGLSHAILVECFRMAFCDREFERTGDLKRSGHYQYFRTRADSRWELFQEAEAAALREEERSPPLMRSTPTRPD